MYDFDTRALRGQMNCFRDTTASASPVGLFYHGHYHRLIIAPATSNTVAKMVWGVADTLITNIYAQAGKCRIPSIVFACDTEPVMETEAPDGMVMVYPRRVDLENVERLRCFEYSLRRAAAYALAHGFDRLTTSLTVSPHKRSPDIFRVGRNVWEAGFLEVDFKKRDGFRRSLQLAEELGMVRQDYCGCEFSLADARKRRRANP